MERVVEAADSVFLSNIKTEPVDIIDTETNSRGAGEPGTTVVNILLFSLIVLLLCCSTPGYASTIVVPYKVLQGKTRHICEYINESNYVIISLDACTMVLTNDYDVQ